MIDLAAYHAFLERKKPLDRSSGVDVDLDEVNPALKPHVRVGVQWALRGGRRALFWNFGLHKTSAQLEIMRLLGPRLERIHEALGDPGHRLIVLPLGIRQEFIREAAARFTGEYALKVKFIRSTAEIEGLDTIYLTNYESVREGLIDLSLFGALSLDEAAVLRSFGSKTFGEFLFGPAMAITYRFVATATPDPNEFLELIAYAHFLGVMDMGEAKTRFFRRNSEKADQLTLHPHKEEEFWLWVSTWAMFVQRPSDLGFSDEGYDLPPLDVRWHEIPTDHGGAGEEKSGQGRMFKNAAIGVSDAAREKRDSLAARVAKMLELRAEDPGAHRLIWHDLEAERAAIERAIPDVATVYGSQDLEVREDLVAGFSDGAFAELGAKPVMLGSGCNLQRHCWWEIFLGIGFKFNEFIQAIHRVQRFGQAHSVRIDLLYTEAEREVRRKLEAKWRRHEEQAARMAEIIRRYGLSHAAMDAALERSMGVEREEASGEGWRMVLNDCVEETARMADASVGLIVTSIPFSTQYEYSPSYNDFGHTDTAEHFWAQMDFLTPELFRVLEPGRVLAVHIKDRVTPGAITGLGFQTVSFFHSDAIQHYRKHGFAGLGMITISTDVVRENAQTYRLGWTELCKDASRMGCGLPEYVLLLRRPPSDPSNGYADNRVTKTKDEFTRARWQFDAAGVQRSSGNRLLMPEDLVNLVEHQIFKAFRKHSLENVYDYEHDVRLAEACDAKKMLPETFSLLQLQTHCPEIWADVVRMRSLNTEQVAKGREKHLCPLPLDIAQRLVFRYSNKGDVVYDPFAGLGTVPLVALEMERIGWGCELARTYWSWSVDYARAKALGVAIPDMFEIAELDRQEEAAA